MQTWRESARLDKDHVFDGVKIVCIAAARAHHNALPGAEVGSRSPYRVHRRRDLRVRTLVAMAKPRPSRPRPLTLRSLSALVHAHHTAFASPETCT